MYGSPGGLFLKKYSVFKILHLKLNNIKIWVFKTPMLIIKN